jgi:hypothetical protein
VIVDDNGHSAMEPGISAELVKACDRYRDSKVVLRVVLTHNFRGAGRRANAGQGQRTLRKGKLT